MPISAGPWIGSDQVVGGLRIGPRRVFGEHLIRRAGRIIRAARVFRASIGRGNGGNVLLCRHRYLRRAGEIFRDADTEVALVLHVSAHNRYIVEMAGRPRATLFPYTTRV